MMTEELFSAGEHDVNQGQCNSSYGFLVTVRITVSNFCIFQLQLLLLLTYLTFSK